MDSQESKIRIAIVGFGNIGSRHAFFLSQNDRYTIEAVCDLKPEKANIIPVGARFYTSIQALLSNEKPDIVSICTPNGLHKEHAVQCMRAGRDVLVEKPLCLHVDDAEEMRRNSMETGKNIYTIMQNRFNPAVQFAKKLLSENKIGPLLQIQVNCYWNRDANYYLQSDWHGTKALDGGILFTQFSHFVDILVYFAGFGTNVDFGKVQNLVHQDCSEVEDQGSFILTKEDCTISVNYSVNATHKNMEGSILLIGTDGMLKIGGQYINRVDYCELNTDMDELYATINDINAHPVNNNQYNGYQGSMSNHDKVFDNLADHVLNGKNYYTNWDESAEVVRIIENMYKTAKIV